MQGPPLSHTNENTVEKFFGLDFLSKIQDQNVQRLVEVI